MWQIKIPNLAEKYCESIFSGSRWDVEKTNLLTILSSFARKFLNFRFYWHMTETCDQIFVYRVHEINLQK